MSRPSLWFVIPAHGRPDLARVCFRQLARTCETLTANGIDASAVVVADDANLDHARAAGLGTVERDNRQLGRKINDGFELAGREGVQYVAALGNDDWIDPALILSAPLPAHGEVRCSRQSAVVREDGQRLAKLRIDYDGGDGVRIYPTSLLQPLAYRPADEDHRRAIDTSIITRVVRANGRNVTRVYHDLHALQIVDWKSETQLNSYSECLAYQDGDEITDPFSALGPHYPAESLKEMAALYTTREMVAA